MKNRNIVLIIAAVLLIGLTSYFLIYEKDEYYNQVEIGMNNTILNGSNMPFIDTVLSVGLDQAGLTGITVTVQDLSESVKSKFDGDLRAHIRYFNGIYYMFLNDLSHREAITVVSHEIIHILQYNSGDLVFDGINVFWKGEEFSLENLPYEERPWEREAFRLENDLDRRVTEVLY